MTFVLDASVTLTWFMPDEDKSDSLLQRVTVEGAFVAMIGPIEIANALLGAVRRGRMTGQHRSRAIRQLDALPIERDTETLFHAWTTTLELAERHRLTVYDACYLELAQRRGLPLATLDRELHHAGKKLGLELLGI